jgi:plastocyanin
MATSTKRFIVTLTTAVGLAVLVSGTTGFAAAVRTIQIMDQCDPETFNAKFGNGTCVGNAGGVKLDVFISQLMKHGKAGAWHFTPDPVRLREGEEFSAFNHGGEAHTFTEVDEFGGGFVQDLNDILGLTPTPECAALALTLPAGLVFPGQSTDPEDEDVGVHHYQCCIHPWMQTDVIVR